MLSDRRQSPKTTSYMTSCPGMSRICDSTETVRSLVVAGGWRMRKGEVAATRCGVSLGSDDNVLKLGTQ